MHNVASYMCCAADYFSYITVIPNHCYSYYEHSWLLAKHWYNIVNPLAYVAIRIMYALPYSSKYQLFAVDCLQRIPYRLVGVHSQHVMQKHCLNSLQGQLLQRFVQFMPCIKHALSHPRHCAWWKQEILQDHTGVPSVVRGLSQKDQLWQ